MIRGQWYFPKDHPGVTVNSSAFRNTLTASGFDISEVLAREAIQNSVDAALKGRKPRVCFRLETFEGEKKKNFVAALGLRNDEWERRKNFQFYKKAELRELVSPREPITLLYIDDFETCGLYGDPYSKNSESHLKRLLFELGNDSKAASSGASGGSFGFGGKSVFLVSGRHPIVIAYSVFDPKMDDRGAYAQLNGVGYLENHDLDGESFTAYPEFSKHTETKVGRSPWIDEEAEILATQLGFVRRSRRDTGTSILIPGATVTIDAIRRAIELWWWPRIVSNELDIELYEDGIEQPPPRPRSRPELKAYIECFLAIEGGASRRVDVSEVRWGSRTIGRLALRLRDDSPSDDDDDESEDEGARNGIALIRSPRMVVDYHQGVHRRVVPTSCQGVFVADPVIDNTLRLSENAAHSVWDSKSERLHSIEDGASLVQELLKAIRKRAREYAKHAQPPVLASNLRVPLLENFLAEALRSGRKGSIVPPAEPVPVRMKNVEPRREFRGRDLFLIGSPTVELDASSPARRAIIKVTCVPKEEGRSSWTDKIPVRFADSTAKNGDDHIEYLLLPGQPIRVDFEVGPYNPEWSIDFRLDVEFPESKVGTR